MTRSFSVEAIWAMSGNSWMQMESALGVGSPEEVRHLLATHGFKLHGVAKRSFSVGPCLCCNESLSVEFLNAKHICRACEAGFEKPDPMLVKERRLSKSRRAERLPKRLSERASKLREAAK